MEVSGRADGKKAVVIAWTVVAILAAITAMFLLVKILGEDRRIERQEFEAIQSEAVVKDYFTSSPHSAFARVFRHLEKSGVFNDAIEKEDNYHFFYDNIRWEVSSDRESLGWRVAVDVYLDLSLGGLLQISELKVPIWVYLEENLGLWSVTEIQIDD